MIKLGAGHARPEAAGHGVPTPREESRLRHTRGAVILVAAVLAAECGGGGGSTTSPSGITTLQVVDLQPGTGVAAATGDSVVVHYTGWLYDKGKSDNKGTMFDTSSGGSPFGFLLGADEVIPGFEQGVVGMKAGGLRRVTIPPELGYGASGSGSIPPNATLIFEVQLVEIRTPAITELQILDLEVGTGTEAATGKQVSVYYTGWLYDASAVDHKGTQFGSQTDTAVVFTLGAGQAITGIERGVVGMKVGGLRRLSIPPHLAFGSGGSATVPANTPVIYEIRLVTVG
jgi:peptidylprolyl isomerase